MSVYIADDKFRTRILNYFSVYANNLSTNTKEHEEIKKVVVKKYYKCFNI